MCRNYDLSSRTARRHSFLTTAQSYTSAFMFQNWQKKPHTQTQRRFVGLALAFTGSKFRDGLQSILQHQHQTKPNQLNCLVIFRTQPLRTKLALGKQVPVRMPRIHTCKNMFSEAFSQICILPQQTMSCEVFVLHQNCSCLHAPSVAPPSLKPCIPFFASVI